MQDMVPRDKRSIRNIPVSPNHRRIRRPGEHVVDPGDASSRRRFGRTFWMLAAAVAALVGGSAIFLSAVFAGAIVTVYPRVERVTPPATLEARLNPPVGMLAYETLTLERTATTTVRATGVTHVSRQASGAIVIYNAFSTQEQRLIANTRFEAPGGRIYRIRDSVVVPGATRNADGSLVPGELTVTVYADSPGQEYNRSEPTRFTIPGFRGDPRYERFYAESRGPISGGFIGEEPAVPPEEFARAEAALRLEIDAAMRAAASVELPPGYLLIPGTLSISYSNLRRLPAGDNAILSQSAVGTAAIIRESMLAEAIARARVSGYGGEAVEIYDTSSLSISLATSSPVTEALTLSLDGDAVIVWQFDPAEVVQTLLGRERQELDKLVEMLAPAVVRVEATIRPFWQQRFPSDPATITVVPALSDH